ncbi:hypothetical protein GQ473_02360 [archaeon]|nr:hypothetical protein [archaeon]
MTWTNLGGGDHEGVDWTPSNSDVISGNHYNIGTFTITSGYNIYVSVASPGRATYNELYISAETISIIGTLHGEKRGFAGGSEGSNGSGPGYGDAGAGCNGGGGGYGGRGGVSCYGVYGAIYGSSDTAFIQRGSGGGGGIGSGSGYSRIGGNGGGGVKLFGNTISITGNIYCYGGGGGTSVSNSGGGGSGGGIFIYGGDVTISGILNANGGGSAYGGRGGGGRIKIFYSAINTTGSTITASLGGVGAEDGTSTTIVIGQCTSTRSYGQTFQYAEQGILSKVTLWVNSINTPGDFTLKLFDDTLKTTELASKTMAISDTGAVNFELSEWEIILEDDEYYLELNPDSTGDIELGVYGYSEIVSGAYYENELIVPYFNAYYILTGITHVIGPDVYNTSAATVKSNVANIILIGAIHRINADSSGIIQYADDFTTNKYLADYSVIANVTYDSGNNELDIADDGYIAYLIDCKYSVDGIPTLTAQIDITAGIPTIQISTDSITWYDIDDAIIDDTLTIYNLNNTVNLQLDGLTIFYFRFNCDASSTCSIKEFELNINIDTTTAQNPYIFYDTVNTFKCDQDVESGMNCTVDLIAEESILQPITIF